MGTENETMIPQPPAGALAEIETQERDIMQAFAGCRDLEDDQHFERAAETLRLAQTLLKRIDDETAPTVQAAHEAHKRAVALRKRLRLPVEQAAEHLRSLIGRYTAKREAEARAERERQQRLLREAAEQKAREEAEARRRAEAERLAAERAEREAERARLEAEAEQKRIEQDRLEEEARLAEERRFAAQSDFDAMQAEQEAAEARERASEASRQAAVSECAANRAADFIANTEARERAIEDAPLEVAPVSVPQIAMPVCDTPKATGVSTRTVWDFEIDDVEAIPRTFMIPDTRAIADAVRRRGAQHGIAGVRAFERQIVTARRA